MISTPVRVNPWPYAIGGVLALFFILVVAFGVYASRQRFDLVRADYYAEELRHDAQAERRRRTHSLAGGVSVTALPDGALAVQVPPGHADKAFTGRLQLYRPSDARLDHETELHPDAAGRQTLDARLAPGPWRVRLGWTRGGEEYLHETLLVVPGVPMPARGPAGAAVTP